MSGELVARLFVPGRPRTKGSLKPRHIAGRGGRPCKVGLTEDHALSTPWKNTMIKAMRRAHPDPVDFVPFNAPVEVHAFFRFTRDVSVAAKTRGQVVPSHQTEWPTDGEIGDEDKLRRNVLDALTQSGLIIDDRMVIGGMNVKRWVQQGEQSGVLIVVRAASSLADVLEAEQVASEP